MISEGRFSTIMVLLERARRDLAESLEAEDGAEATILSEQAKRKLEAAIYHGLRIDQPLGPEDVV